MISVGHGADGEFKDNQPEIPAIRGRVPEGGPQVLSRLAPPPSPTCTCLPFTATGSNHFQTVDMHITCAMPDVATTLLLPFK